MLLLWKHITPIVMITIRTNHSHCWVFTETHRICQLMTRCRRLCLKIPQYSPIASGSKRSKRQRHRSRRPTPRTWRHRREWNQRKLEYFISKLKQVHQLPLMKHAYTGKPASNIVAPERRHGAMQNHHWQTDGTALPPLKRKQSLKPHLPTRNRMP